MIIVVLLVAFVAAAGTLVVGGILARKAGAGSSRALTGWIVTVVVEVLIGIQLVVAGGLIPALIVAVALALQVALFFKGRSERPPGVKP